MQKLELFDETFDPDRTESYELSIQASLDGFSFCVKDTSRNFFIGLVSSPFDVRVKQPDEWLEHVKFLFSSYKWLTKRFKKVNFCYESPSFTIIPQQFFEKEKAKYLLKAVHPIDELDEIWHTNHDGGITSIYNIPSPLVGEWLKIQGKSHIIGFCDPTLSFHRLTPIKADEILITLSLSNSFAIVIISKGSALLHSGSIDFRTPEDTVYHLANICQGLGLSIDKLAIRILGHSNDWERIESLIERFFLAATKVSTVEQNHFSYLLNKYKGRFANLFNQSLCE